MPFPKPSLRLDLAGMDGLVEAGMDLYALWDGRTKVVLARTNGYALPWFKNPDAYDIYDLMAGIEYPLAQSIPYQGPTVPIPSRPALVQALRRTRIASAYVGGPGAFPLIGSTRLSGPAIFYRLLSIPTDPRFKNGYLSAGTYLTTELDRDYANSGYSAVGRYALPLPLPASHLIQYELPAGTVVSVGTVAPNFGQAGGGVEVRLSANVRANSMGSLTLHDY